MVGPKSETMTKSEKVKAAAAEIIPLLNGTPIEPEDFKIMKGYNGLLDRAIIRRAWAYGKGNMKLSGAIDKLINELEK